MSTCSYIHMSPVEERSTDTAAPVQRDSSRNDAEAHADGRSDGRSARRHLPRARRSDARAHSRRACGRASCASAISPSLVGISESAVSHQLRLLRGMRLVRPRRAGRLVYYAVDDQHILESAHSRRSHSRRRIDGLRGDEHLSLSASCTPSRRSRSRAWTATRKWRSSSAG